MIELQFAECRMRIDHEARCIETVFEDGASAPARPNWRTGDIRRATNLGYHGDCWQMCIDHEALHTLVGELRGFGHSVILWNVSHGDANVWPEQGREEEGYVTSLQRFLRRGERDDLVSGLMNQACDRAGLYPSQVLWLARGLVASARDEQTTSPGGASRVVQR